jgi:hypothetical protein
LAEGFQFGESSQKFQTTSPFHSINGIERIISFFMAVPWLKHKHAAARRLFTAAEDAQLLRVVGANPGQPWEVIASQMNDRTPRQCRERYTNYLAPCLRVADWTPKEDALLLEKINELGSAWAAIRHYFSGRSENDIKNRWYSHLRFSTFLDVRSRRHYFIDPSQSAFSVRRKRFRVKPQPSITARKILGGPSPAQEQGSGHPEPRPLDPWPDFGEDCFELFTQPDFF